MWEAVPHSIMVSHPSNLWLRQPPHLCKIGTCSQYSASDQ